MDSTGISETPLDTAAAFLASCEVVPTGFSMPRKSLTIGQVFGQLATYATAGEQVAWLRHNVSPALVYLLRVAFEPSVEWLLPKGLPPYKPYEVRRHGKVVPIKPGQAPSELLVEMRRLYMFLKGGNDTMNQMRREKLFQEIIESMEAIEVDILLTLKDKKFVKFVDPAVVNAAFPGILNTPFQVRFIR